MYWLQKSKKKTIHTIKGRPKLQNKKGRPILIGNLGFGSIEIFKNQIESIVLARYAQCPNICNNKNCMLFFCCSFYNRRARFICTDATDFNTFIVNGCLMPAILLNQEATIKTISMLVFFPFVRLRLEKNTISILNIFRIFPLYETIFN